MPGRQAHGRPLISAKSAPKPHKKSSQKVRARALDAFGIASEQFPTKEKKTPRFREINADVGRKHSREEDDEDEDDEDDEDEAQSRRKRVKPSAAPAGDDEEDEFGSDSEGNEWRYGVGADDDSELDSDEAFGESDEEEFQGYTFGKSSQKKTKKTKQDHSDDDHPCSIWRKTSQTKKRRRENLMNVDSSKLDALQTFISGYGGEDGKEDAPDGSKPRQKISFKDLGLAGVKDPQMKKSMKLMSKEEKEARPGGAKKLAIPLGKRQQDKLSRAVAYEKTNETLDRWTDRVKQDRRAEHLVFPLPENAQDAGLNHDELAPITSKTTGNELEQTIMSIMEQSGLALNKEEEKRIKAKDNPSEGLSKEALQELVNQKRQEKELRSREAKRNKRIKKIKSKAYHRVHRRQRERDELKLHEAMAEAGEIDSEEERDAQDRARALERVGARHRDSRWAKAGNSNKRAVWDDDYRSGLHDMARREEELRQRKEGRAGNASDDDDDEYSDSGSEDGKNRDLLAQLDRAEKYDDDEPKSALMKMKSARTLPPMPKDVSDEEVEEIGRKKYGGEQSSISAPALTAAREKKRAAAAAAAGEDNDAPSGKASRPRADAASLNIGTSITADGTALKSDAWSSNEPRRKNKKHAPVVDTISTTDIIKAGSKRVSKSTKSSAAGTEMDVDGDDADLHLPLAIRDVDQLDRAFAGDNVVEHFAAEKAEMETEQDDKVIDETLPGWGNWVGDGVSARDKARHKGKVLRKVEGIKKANRKDAKLEKVIINEKRVKNNDKYLASQLPHQFESRAQYERSLRLPMGPEWQTKESFQDATKPRVLVKQGIIAPMLRPTR
ncbi:small nucleolar ribonucleoprotein complex subunit Utp14 [Verticillium dahliae VdLs.17]|uniref:Small nucleolar ribonucleoprotein complex subunit Utp14 n=1 Tax=Verticillium dahliae (strain VdLs.17 / ATCC MYA-4575 / FGSC 10137) TaxID=498257 RepID=G2WSD4_VERDV|nr:small nucleolar ribonucleoprotein complex subunit Utp14 [Verticillium dahliae VdLs.17]EGY17855.1 small nucleolar ribonucleoprotein complex subunit Utp14 [Verticillium dahliae VdLs.17]